MVMVMSIGSNRGLRDVCDFSSGGMSGPNSESNAQQTEHIYILYMRAILYKALGEVCFLAANPHLYTKVYQHIPLFNKYVFRSNQPTCPII